MIAMHRSQPQHHPSFQVKKFFPSKAVGFNTAANPVTENCLKFGFWIVRNLNNFLIILIQKLFDMMMIYTQIDNLNVTHSKHAYLNEL
jgi:hypothetical protein